MAVTSPGLLDIFRVFVRVIRNASIRCFRCVPTTYEPTPWILVLATYASADIYRVEKGLYLHLQSQGFSYHSEIGTRGCEFGKKAFGPSKLGRIDTGPHFLNKLKSVV